MVEFDEARFAADSDFLHTRARLRGNAYARERTTTK
jgi:hypothetical protein